MQIQARWFRRERTFRAATKLQEALERFRLVSTLDNAGGAQLVILMLATDLCRQLGETRTSQALEQRLADVNSSNEAALARSEELSRKRKAARARQGDTEKETTRDVPAARTRRRPARNPRQSRATPAPAVAAAV